MEIVTAPPTPAPSTWGRLAVLLAVFAPVTVLALLPIGFGLDRYVVTSGAMSPTIDRGSVVLEREVPTSDLRPGDVITFDPPPGTDPSGPVTRRIVSIEAGVAHTRADSAEERDPWALRLDQPTRSKVVAVLPWVGYVYLTLVAPGPGVAMAAGALGVAGLALALALGRRRTRGRA